MKHTHAFQTNLQRAAVAVAVVGLFIAVQAVELRVETQRLLGEPLIKSVKIDQDNGPHTSNYGCGTLMFPTLIKVPDWAPAPLGKYYLYCAHHAGKHLMLFYADEITGPYTEAPFPMAIDPDQSGHMSAPDVHIDEENQRFIMYYHASWINDDGTGVAFSDDGKTFTPDDRYGLGSKYWRSFTVEGDDNYYAFSRIGFIRKSAEPFANYEKLLALYHFYSGFPCCRAESTRGEICKSACGARHPGVYVKGSVTYLFFSLFPDQKEYELGLDTVPEHIQMCRLENVSAPPEEWVFAPAEYPLTVLKPELDWEGGNLDIMDYKKGEAKALREPFVYEEDNQLYLLYSGMGEQQIGIAKLWIYEDGVPLLQGDQPTGAVTGASAPQAGRPEVRRMRCLSGSSITVPVHATAGAIYDLKGACLARFDIAGKNGGRKLRLPPSLSQSKKLVIIDFHYSRNN
ncbi:MAG: hypothetical protein GF350_04385 [Chitinivibrionales bacterium]|nr:hypothetical protein [Chitinivibrionales bacterium]